MTTVTKALDHLTDVLAGSDVTLKGTKADCIMQLADMIEDGTIVIGGGGGDLGVTFTPNEDLTVWTCDKTYAEIAAAIEAGQFVYGKFATGSVLNLINTDLELGSVDFQVISITGTDCSSLLLTVVNNTDEVYYEEAFFDFSSLVAE